MMWMIEVVKNNLGEISTLCRRYGVGRLELIGSAASGGFDPEGSDVDFVVSFKEGVDLGSWLSHYFELKEELEEVVGRPVDLVMEGTPTNPYFIESVEESREPSLEFSKLYRIILDAEAETHGYIRVVDESGEDYYAFSSGRFHPIELPQAVERTLLAASQP